MADRPPPTPLVYASSAQSSPSKIGSWISADPGKLGDPLKHNAPLDRKLAVWDNMNRSMLVDLDVFEDEVLWSQDKGPFPEPTERAKRIATEAVQSLFYPDGSATPANNISEDAIAQMIVRKVINRVGLPNKHKAALSQSMTCLTDGSLSKVDAAIYSEDRLPADGRPDWTNMRLFIEFKKGGTRHDPFDDDAADGQAESWAESRKKVRGQLLSYMHDVFLYQHRSGLYSLFINGPEFRAMRWDRSGVLATRATNYAQDPVSLLRVLWAFALFDLVEQGSDPTAILLSPHSAEYKRMDLWAKENKALDMPHMPNSDLSQFFPHTAASGARDPPQARSAPTTQFKAIQPTTPVFEFVRKKFRESLVSDWPRYKLFVGPDGREFLVGKPDFHSKSMFGRGTRGYVALDLRTGELVWLKDSWRPFYVGVEPEGNYLATMAADLKDRLVVPTVIAHGDVGGQCTFASTFTSPKTSRRDTQGGPVCDVRMAGTKRRYEEYVSADTTDAVEDQLLTTKQGLCHLVHYRIAVAEICLPLDEFQCGAQLLKLIENCIATHRDAYEKFGLLHRDISTGNILILPRVFQKNGKATVNWHGLLTDWELAKYVPRDNSRQRVQQSERTGTWPFMSVGYIQNPEWPVVVADDLESFFHVMLYQSVRYLRHSLGSMATDFVKSYFDTFQLRNDGTQLCSNTKIRTVNIGKLEHGGDLLEFFTRKDEVLSPINDFFQEWLALFVERYRTASELGESDVSLESEDEDGFFAGYDDDGNEIPFDPRVATLKVRIIATELQDQVSLPEKLRDHTATLDLFRRYRTTLMWPRMDKVGDQVSKEYDPRPHVIAARSQVESALVQASTEGSGLLKKPRLDPEASIHRDAGAPSARPSGSSASSNRGASRDVVHSEFELFSL
ncbi:hypothetical protein ONZ51_g11490 [Trametes cubensis]|uniref:Fungal-type protein kinase domain-containing protein n=1 Tax=Trametes cubensis TaxID=1111947 RepID=A0AAD7X5R8_9APHY|nr:hypothetical protein ONZ51_g11490 [Trametes cubensis]